MLRNITFFCVDFPFKQLSVLKRLFVIVHKILKASIIFIVHHKGAYIVDINFQPASVSDLIFHLSEDNFIIWW